MTNMKHCQACGTTNPDDGRQECIRCGSADTYTDNDDLDGLWDTIRQMAKYYYANPLNFQYEKMGEYIRRLQAMLPENTP